MTHVDISAADIDRALEVFPEAWRAIGGGAGLAGAREEVAPSFA